MIRMSIQSGQKTSVLGIIFGVAVIRAPIFHREFKVKVVKVRAVRRSDRALYRRLSDLMRSWSLMWAMFTLAWFSSSSVLVIMWSIAVGAE